MAPLEPWSYPYGGIPVFQDFGGIQFSLVHTINKGAAWGVFSDYQWVLLGVRIVLIGALTAYIFYCSAIYVLPLSLILAGALGNVIDTFLYGHVIDMFKFVLWGYHYPVFNIADMAITCGIAWLFVVSWYEKKSLQCH